jgi:1-acyl-sn-glycerol-3-phosphate acyltransferase
MLRGALTILLLLLNALLWGAPIFVGGVIRFITPGGPLRGRIILFLARLADHWVEGCNRIFDRMLTTVWDIQGIEDVHRDGHYLIISNHVSWVDIFVLFRAFHGRTAFIRFFLKQELIWMPIVGQACWALQFPFMKRYTAEYLERHPEKRGTDLATTRRACRRYRHVPVTILNFLEGTRFSCEKHADQESPYRHLLRPRIGGIGFVLASLGDQIDALFDVTIAYPGGDSTFWQFVTNRLPRISVRARPVLVPPEFFEAAITEPGPERDRFKAWIEEIWREKDLLLDQLLQRPSS